jgi:hypothetical protein
VTDGAVVEMSATSVVDDGAGVIDIEMSVIVEFVIEIVGELVGELIDELVDELESSSVS